MSFDPHTAIPYLVTVVLLILVLRRAGSTRKVRIERLWLWPTLLVLAAVSMLAGAGPLSTTAIAGLLAAFIAGAGVGWWRGQFTKITIDPASQELTSQMSPMGVIIVAGLFLLRYFIRTVIVYQPGALPGGLSANAGLITEGFVVFGVGFVAAQQLELWLRCRRLLVEARATG